MTRKLELACWLTGVALLALFVVSLIAGDILNALYAITMGCLVLCLGASMAASYRSYVASLDVIRELSEDLRECTQSHYIIVNSVQKAIETRDLTELERLMALLTEEEQ